MGVTSMFCPGNGLARILPGHAQCQGRLKKQTNNKQLHILLWMMCMLPGHLIWGGCPDVLCSVHSTEQLKDVKVCDSQFHSFVQAH